MNSLENCRISVAVEITVTFDDLTILGNILDYLESEVPSPGTVEIIGSNVELGAASKKGAAKCPRGK